MKNLSYERFCYFSCFLIVLYGVLTTWDFEPITHYFSVNEMKGILFLIENSKQVSYIESNELI